MSPGFDILRLDFVIFRVFMNNMKFISLGGIFSPKTSARQAAQIISRSSSTQQAVETGSEEQPQDADEFRVLDLWKPKAAPPVRRRREPTPVLPPRANRMAIDQKWSDVWPGPRTFHPAVVPLPIRQGLNKLGPSPSKWANAELMKIPNFLHLTPPAIKLHCAALKKFCTDWPKGLETEADMTRHFPVEVITTDYCHSSPSIRDPLSRIVTIRFPLDRLKFDRHSRDKFLRLVGERYDATTDLVTIVTDKCPVKVQNYNYAFYLLTAVYYESWITEPWEKDRLEEDMEYYDWDNSQSRKNVEYYLKQSNSSLSLESDEVKAYSKAVVDVFDDGENSVNWHNYKKAALKVIFSK